MLDEGATIKIPEFAYDALGRRIRKSDCVADTNTLYYYNDNWQVLCEYNGGGSFERMFMYGNYIDEPIMTYSGGIYFYVQDHLYSTAALVDTGTSQSATNTTPTARSIYSMPTSPTMRMV